MKLALAVLVLPLFLAGGGSVTPGPALSVPRAAHTATLLQTGKVLIAGGCTADSCELDAEGATTELYDPAENHFEHGPRLTRPRVSHTASRLPNGDVLLVGGWDGDRPTATAELYDASTGRFVATGSMRAGRGGATATPLPGGRVLIVGGTAGGRLLRTAEIYALRRRFGRFGSTGVRLSFATATLLADGRVLFAGGYDDSITVSRRAWLIRP